MKRRVLLIRDDGGSQMTIGPVCTDQPVDQLRCEITGHGWTVSGTCPHYSRADFTGASGRGMGPVKGDGR
jgi:hypothetical protein